MMVNGLSPMIFTISLNERFTVPLWAEYTLLSGVRIDKICKTCGFDSNGVCGMYTTCKEGEECDDWEASLEYYTEITKKAPWYIKKPYDHYIPDLR